MKTHHILKNFINTEGVSISTETLKSGHINDTYKVTVNPLDNTNAQDTYILQRVNAQIFTEPQKIMSNIEQVALHLRAKNYPQHILSCIKTREGENFHHNTEGYWRMIPYISNTYSIIKAENESQAYEAAWAFGEYLNYLNDIDVSKIETIIPNFHNAPFRIMQFNEALKNCQLENRLALAQKELEYCHERLDFYKNYIAHVPIRVTHNDTKISNILFDKTTQKASCIIDLDTLQPETLLSDFGDMVRTYTPQYDEDEQDIDKIEMRLEYMKALIEGFLSQVKNFITPEERANLIYGAKRTIFVQALRFLADYLNSDTYYKTHYEEQNLNRTKNQIALLKSLERHEKALHKMVMES